MAEKMKASQNRINTRVGALVISEVERAEISSIKLPSLDDRFIVIGAKDLGPDNILKLFSGSMPIFAHKEVSFKGQPILAIFGPNYESVSLAVKETYVEYAPVNDDPTLLFNSSIEPEVLTFGSEASLSKEGLRVVESTYVSSSITSDTEIQETIGVYSDGTKYHVEFSTQWPDFTKRNIASILNISEKNIVIHTGARSTSHDEYLIMPTLGACICAVAAMKLQSSVELKTKVLSSSPNVTIKHKTYVNGQGKPICQEVDYLGDLGAFIFDANEFQRQVLTGLIPPYPVEYFKAEAKITTSNNPPALFFGDMGFSDALASNEVQLSKIASTFELSPDLFKATYCIGKSRFSDYLPSLELESISKTANKTASSCNFPRKWASYEILNNGVNILPFTRGIGLSSGFSIQGFSTSFVKDKSYQARLTLTEKGNITIVTSMYTKGDINLILKDIIKRELEEYADVTIYDNDSSVIDSGPDVLFRSLGQLSHQLVAACRKLRELTKTEPLPISIFFDVDDKLNPCEFLNSGIFSAAVELSIDNITYIPTIYEVWVNVKIGTIYDMNTVIDDIRSTTMATLIEAGAMLSADIKRPFKVNINAESDNTDNFASVRCGVMGCVKAAFINALSQCVPKLKTITLPISAETVQNSISSKGGKL